MLPLQSRPILTAARMRVAEAASGVDAGILMGRAGEAVAVAVARLASRQPVLIVCGPGNNGGDGYVAAAALKRAGHPVRVAASAASRTDAARQAREGWNGPVEPLAAAVAAPVLVDALYGTGLSRPLAEEERERLGALTRQAALTIAVDLPSGVATDDGRVLSQRPGAAVTLALGAAKPSHLLFPAAGLCGEVRVLDIGLDIESDTVVLPRPSLSPPVATAHKFSRGMVAVVAGRMPGASALAATAAARLAGYVLLLGAATDRLPHAVVRRRWSGDALADPRIGAVVIGPGLGRDELARGKLAGVLASDHPVVIDGDALRLLDLPRLRDRPAAAVITPHEGEFAHLFPDLAGSRIDRARAAAERSGATVVLKGPDTVIADPGGQVGVACCPVPWLATAGSGDVLAGVIGGLLSTRPQMEAASAGVWLHTEAARRAGPALIADDLAAALPAAVAECAR